MVSRHCDIAGRQRFCRHRGLLHEPAESRHQSSGISSALPLPAALQLRFVAGATALLWLTYLLLTAARGFDFSTSILIATGASLSSLGLMVYTTVTRVNAAHLRAIGSAYLIVIAFALAVTELSTPTSLAPHGELAFSAVWITLFPLVVPANPRRILVETSVAACASMAAAWLVSPVSPASHGYAAWSLRFAPLFLAALLAHAAAVVLSRLGKQVAGASDLGMYELESRIALGGMGEVWRAKHRLLSRPAAIKLIRPEREGTTAPEAAAGDSIARQRFQREAHVTASLKSPHTVELYDFGVTDTGAYYYVMELLEGDDLEQLVQREGPLDAARVVHILEQTLDSLAEAHEQGLVHRDVKPANIHISHRGLEREFVKVLDFGLVKSSVGKNMDMTLSFENRVVGTPAYLAPEAITGESPVDARADVYSLGCVAYYLLTGKLVFEAENAMSMAIAHVTAEPTPPSKRTRQLIPPMLERIVLACLEKSPERRPRSAVALLEMLQELDLHRSVVQSGELPMLASSDRELNSAAVN